MSSAMTSDPHTDSQHIRHANTYVALQWSDSDKIRKPLSDSTYHHGSYASW